MSDKDIFKDLFSKKLENYEASVNPKVWSAISSKIGVVPVAGSAVGVSFISKLLIGLSISAVVVGGIVLVYTNVEQKPERKKAKQTIVPSTLIVKEDLTTVEKEGAIINTSKKNILNTDEKTRLNIHLDIPIIPIKSVEDVVVEPLKNKSAENKSSNPHNEIYKTSIQDVIAPVSPIIETTPLQDLKLENNEVIEKIKLPNTFTPNMDGVNDEFKILLVDVTAFSIVILDVRNKIVYKSEDPDFKWNGVGLNGEMVDAGNYIYYITAKNSQGKDVLEYSILTIIR